MRSSSVLLLWLPLVAASKTKATDPVEGAAEIDRGMLATRPTQNVSAATAAIDRWFQFHQNNESYAPEAWTVTKPHDVPRPWHEIGASSKSKTVYRATVKGKSVIVKGRKMRKDGKTSNTVGGGVLYLEMVYLEALRGRPGIPELLGAFWDGPHVVIVVADAGGAIGEGPPGVGTAPNVMTAAFDARARNQPLALARSVLECFGSWALDFFQDDLKAQQFTMDAHGTVFMVDGPKVAPDRPLGRAIHEAWGTKVHHGSKGDHGALDGEKHKCKRDADCPFTKENHSCRGAGTCEPGARGAPEARGKCHNTHYQQGPQHWQHHHLHHCVQLSEKTHVYDVANRPWLLPYIAAKAADPAAGEFLRSLIRLAGRGRPEDRPSFRELVDRIDAFAKAPVPFKPGPKARLYESAFIQSNDRRRKAFWDYASVSFTDLGHAGGVLVDGVVQRLCDDRGLACWQSQVDGHGKDVPVPAHLGEEVVDRTKNKYGPLTAEDVEDSGSLDILDGEFPFNVTRVNQALPPKVFAFTVVEDAWRVVESLYVDGGRADDPDAFVNASFPHGVQRHVQRLAGLQFAPGSAITRSQCDRALRNLDAFDLIVDAASLATGGLRDLAAVLHGLYDVEAPRVATVKPVGDLAVTPSLRARVLEDSWCHAEVYAAARSKPAFRQGGFFGARGTPATWPAQNVSAPTAAIDRFFRARETPAPWRIQNVSAPWKQIGHASKAKVVYRARVDDTKVIVKQSRKSGDGGGTTVYMELVYLESLRGRPGVPELLGAWWEASRLTYATVDGGEPISGIDEVPLRKPGARRFATWARKRPLQLARSLLACFWSWASAGWFLDDFKDDQFTLTDDGDVYLVDGPRALATSPVGRAAVREWSRVSQLQDDSVVKCARDADCPRTHYSHSCSHPDHICEPGSVGAPEARGKCLAEGKCALLSEKTHVFDVANRPWLLPGIAARAEDSAARDFLRSLIRLASAEAPEDRPSFAELLDRLDQFENAHRRRA